jgi:succinyl-diaminopimelate desuccinylase
MDPVALTQALIRMNTVNPPGNERACAHFLGDMLEGAGFSVNYYEFADQRTSVVAMLGTGSNGKAPICFAGHVDTVPLGLRPWKYDPFGGTIEDGKLYGRGVTDMKAGVAAYVCAALDLVEEIKQGPGIILVITAGEETGCEGSLHLGTIEGALGKAGALVVAEPTFNIPRVGHKGTIWLKLTSSGKTAHGSMPEHGINAVYKAARAAGKLEEFDFNIAPHKYLGRNTLNLGMMSGGQNVNSVPDAAEMRVDIRTIPATDHDRLCEGLRGYLKEEIDTLVPFVNLHGVWTDPNKVWVQRVFDLSAKHLGERPTVGALPFFTDAAALTPAYGQVQTLILGPGETHMAHQTDEYCMVDRIYQSVAMYKDIIHDWGTS